MEMYLMYIEPKGHIHFDHTLNANVFYLEN